MIGLKNYLGGYETGAIGGLTILGAILNSLVSRGSMMSTNFTVDSLAIVIYLVLSLLLGSVV